MPAKRKAEVFGKARFSRSKLPRLTPRSVRARMSNHLGPTFYLADGPEPIISYRTGWVVYEESLTQGQFVGRGWNGAGYINFYDGRLIPPNITSRKLSGWISTARRWLPTGSGEASRKRRRTMEIRTSPSRCITRFVPSRSKSTPSSMARAILTRWLEITNTGKQPAALAVACPWSGVMRKTERWRSHMNDTKLPLYSLGYFDTANWGEEGDFHWHDMPTAGYRIDGRYRRGRYRQPMFMLRNNAMGELFIGQLAWTGGYSFDFDLDPEMDKVPRPRRCRRVDLQRRSRRSSAAASDCARRNRDHS